MSRVPTYQEYVRISGRPSPSSGWFDGIESDFCLFCELVYLSGEVVYLFVLDDIFYHFQNSFDGFDTLRPPLEPENFEKWSVEERAMLLQFAVVKLGL